MAWRITLPPVLAVALALQAASTPQRADVRRFDEAMLREYTGVYRWSSDAFVYLQLWNEFSGFTKPSQLVAFDESGVVRVLHPADRDRFFTGRGAGVAHPVESSIDFQRDDSGAITALTWRRDNESRRRAQRAAIERREDVRFSSGDAQLAGTLLSPTASGRHPAVILVHGSGAENRDFVLPWARFLIRRGISVLGYDKRGVGGSTGDWQTASFQDLAADVVAAFEYLKTRPDIDGQHIGLLGISQAGWIMPLAAARAKDVAFVISISGAGVEPAETTLDQAKNEMTAAGLRAEMVDEIIGLMKLQYAYARTGEGWSHYAGARDRIASRMGGTPPASFPREPHDPFFGTIRRLYFHDPAPSLRQLQAPLLALWGQLDNNIVAEKNKAAVEGVLKAGGHRDYTLRVLPAANHYLWQAKIGSNRELPTSPGFAREYFTIVHDWLSKRLPGFRPSK